MHRALEKLFTDTALPRAIRQETTLTRPTAPVD